MAFVEENLENGENYDPRLPSHCFLVVSVLRIDAMSSSGNGEDVPRVLSQAREAGPAFDSSQRPTTPCCS